MMDALFRYLVPLGRTVIVTSLPSTVLILSPSVRSGLKRTLPWTKWYSSSSQRDSTVALGETVFVLFGANLKYS